MDYIDRDIIPDFLGGNCMVMLFCCKSNSQIYLVFICDLKFQTLRMLFCNVLLKENTNLNIYSISVLLPVRL